MTRLLNQMDGNGAMRCYATRPRKRATNASLSPCFFFLFRGKKTFLNAPINQSHAEEPVSLGSNDNKGQSSRATLVRGQRHNLPNFKYL
eukprot:m.244756 g.244756  ORF g.244756 m.244756 type:complete len:89 (-) comp19041_c1_seq14:22-288(-)